MPKLPVISGAGAVKVFQRATLAPGPPTRQRVVMLKAGHRASLSIPQHRDLAPGTLRALIRAAGMTVEEFVRLR